VSYQGRPAFRAAFPDSLLRLQRREFYRLTVPIARPLRCILPYQKADGSRAQLEVKVVDISGGGLAVVAPPEGIGFEADAEFPNCRLELPEVGIIVATVKVCSMFEITLRNGSTIKRAGCQFKTLPGPMLTLVQRYIIKVERERKARESGLS
jgi:flagellar brake protein